MALPRTMNAPKGKCQVIGLTGFLALVTGGYTYPDHTPFTPSLGFRPLVAVDVGNAENTAQEINANIASMRVGDGNRRAPGFGHVLMLTPSKRTIESERA
jgi:hypothetical protein